MFWSFFEIFSIFSIKIQNFYPKTLTIDLPCTKKLIINPQFIDKNNYFFQLDTARRDFCEKN